MHAADGQDLFSHKIKYSVSVRVHRSGFFVWSSGGGAALCPVGPSAGRRVRESVPRVCACTAPPFFAFPLRAHWAWLGARPRIWFYFDFVTFSLRDVSQRSPRPRKASKELLGAGASSGPWPEPRGRGGEPPSSRRGDDRSRWVRHRVEARRRKLNERIFGRACSQRCDKRGDGPMSRARLARSGRFST